VLVFAYDGSLNGDWVAHYAVRFAANTPARRLRLVHVHDGAAAPALAERVTRIAAECAVVGVALETEVIARGPADVATRILELTPAGATVIAGTRARPRGRALLAGTISAGLLDRQRVSVIAIRVVHPGALGQPGRVLVPAADRLATAAGMLGVLRLLGPDLEHVHVVLVRALSRMRALFGSDAGAARRLAADRRHLARLEAELRDGLAPDRPLLDGSVVVTGATAHAIALEAARHRSRLIVLDADAPARWRRSHALEQILREAPADVAIYRDRR
jgi:hypothetical protein